MSCCVFVAYHSVNMLFTQQKEFMSKWSKEGAIKLHYMCTRGFKYHEMHLFVACNIYIYICASDIFCSAKICHHPRPILSTVRKTSKARILYTTL